MNKLSTLLMIIIITSSAFSQSPQKMSYQAVIRNTSGVLMVNQAVGMKISILQGSATGTLVYLELQTTITNANGLVTIEIGSGTILTGTFAGIDWSNGPYFIKTETDPSGGTTYTITGTNQLLSVPYALYSRRSGNGFSGSYNDLTNKPSLWDSTWVSIKNKPITIAGYGITDAVDATGNQTIAGNKTFTGTTTVLTPVNATDAATKAYVDALLARIETLELSDLLNNGYIDTRDNNHYNTVKIGNQIWMAENLKYLPSVVGPGTGSQTDPYYYVFGYYGTVVNAAKATANYNTYGVLYNWPAAMNGAASSNTNPSGLQGVCPTGWHLPSDAEWTELTDYLGGTSVAGGKLKETGTTHWNDPNIGASNEAGFTALPGCERDGGETFPSLIYFGYSGYWWCATVAGTDRAWVRIMHSHTITVVSLDCLKELGFSVRCVRD